MSAQKPQRHGQLLYATVCAFDAPTHTATVQPLGSLATCWHAVPVSAQIETLSPGQRVLLALLDEHNCAAAVVLCAVSP